MSVIIRLQNLPWSANSLDIRHYFRGLSIPEGGVHIVGGEMGDAFIAFSTDEDARQAMMLTGGKIKEVQISLMLSSRSEMQKIIEAARQASMSNSLAQLLNPSVVPPSVPTVTQNQQQQQQQSVPAKERRDSKGDKKDSSDLSSGGHESGKTDRKDRRDKSRSRSRDRGRKDRRDRDRDRDRDRRRKSRSRSRSRERRRRRSRSRSRGRDAPNRDRDRKDSKEDARKEDKLNANQPVLEPGTNVPNLDILNPNTWNVMQTGALAQNAQLLTNFELLRNLANQKGPLLPGGPGSILPTPLIADKDLGLDMFGNRRENPSLGPADFGGRNKGVGGRMGNQRNFNNFDDQSYQDNNNAFGRDGRFDRTRNPNAFSNFRPNFPMRNGTDGMNNPRFGNFGRGDNGFLPRGPTPNRERPNVGRGLLDRPVSMPQRDRYSNNRDDGVDEFGRSLQLRNRNNMMNEENFNEGNSMGGDQQNYSGYPNRFGKNQQKPPPLIRGRDTWQGSRNSDGFQDRRSFRGSYEDKGFKSKGRDFGKQQEDNDSSQSNMSPGEDSCVEIRNLAPQIAYGEVRRPFSNLKLIIREIKFFDYTPNDKKCRIKFLNNDNKRKAMQMSNKLVIDSKQVSLLHINDNDFDETVDEGVKRPEVKFSDDEDDSTLTSKDVYIQVKDLPPNADESAVVNLFPNASLEKILMETSSDGKNKVAFVKFQKAVDAKVALGTPNRNIGDSAVLLTSLAQYVFNDHLNKIRKMDGEKLEKMDVEEESSSEARKSDEDNLSCVLMKNLPAEANDRDICDFFSDIGLVPNKIHIMLDMEGQPSGDAFCEFSDVHQMERACSKNSAHLGKNIVTVSQVPKGEMLEALGLLKNSAGGKPPGLMDNNVNQSRCMVALENIPFRAGVFDIISFFGWSYNLTEKDIFRRYNDKGQPTGDGKVCFRTPEDALRAIRFLNNRSLMGRVIRMKLM